MRNDPGVAVITGASAGVGRATARSFARRGWRLALLARGEDGLEAARQEALAAGAPGAVAIAVDVAVEPAVQHAADRAATTLGGIDVWVNNAMATVFSPVEATPAEEIRRVTEVAYLGAVHGTLAALRHMRASGDRGTIVQVGSALSYRAIPLQAPYCGAKFAIRGFTDALRSELIRRRSGIRLSMVQLPAINTPQFDWARNRLPWRPQPVPPIHRPEVAAEAVVKAALRAPRELWVGWASLRAILGGAAAPSLSDRLLARAAWEGQMEQGVCAAADATDNLFAPVPGDHGAAGRFGERARGAAPMISPAQLGAAVATMLVGGAIGIVLMARSTGRRAPSALPPPPLPHPPRLADPGRK